MCSSSTQLRWLSSLVLSCESCWEDGGVESVETPCLSCSEGPPSSTAGLISFSCNDFALQNSFMHDTDEHYSDERQTDDARMEYVRKNGRLDIFTPMMW